MAGEFGQIIIIITHQKIRVRLWFMAEPIGADPLCNKLIWIRSRAVTPVWRRFFERGKNETKQSKNRTTFYSNCTYWCIQMACCGCLFMLCCLSLPSHDSGTEKSVGISTTWGRNLTTPSLGIQGILFYSHRIGILVPVTSTCHTVSVMLTLIFWLIWNVSLVVGGLRAWPWNETWNKIRQRPMHVPQEANVGWSWRSF